MSILLITGANRGLGLEFVRQYAQEGWKVIACCRNPDTATELKQIAQEYPLIQIEPLNVTDSASIQKLVSTLGPIGIDLLINNAGIYSGSSSEVSAETGDISQNLGSLDATAWAKVLAVNTIAPIMVTEALLPQLKAGTGKKVINITSRMGSLTTMLEGSIAYRSSKTGLNAAMRAIAHDFKYLQLIIANLHPGWVQTDMGGKGADLTAEQSVSGMRQTIATLKPEDSGQFLNYDGQVIPW